MKIEGSNFNLGKMGTTFFIWNSEKTIYLDAKNLNEAIREAKIKIEKLKQ
ncbi:hypothetical protein NNL19_05630 [Riemerella anatipestifer]|nr:hypothetical protein [Riemerella anatipestifer]MCQ4155098.1 hypothetical protein [Riemerella anatipestifer]MCQ4181070.1 hypothetical protein [Riemerella anatipestifer]MDR7693174.1 hypothetical protein [Riemerella anatipestifer]MDR7793447.1 hypothetical protein [Riemerella anatipestifer]